MELKLMSGKPVLYPVSRSFTGHDYYLGTDNRGVGRAYDELADSVFSEWKPFIEEAYQAGFIIGRI